MVIHFAIVPAIIRHNRKDCSKNNRTRTNKQKNCRFSTKISMKLKNIFIEFSLRVSFLPQKFRLKQMF